MILDPQEIERLAEKYDRRLPRYTSYPTALEFHSRFSESEWKTSLERDLLQFGPATSLYVHIPFCKTLCFFCACAREGGKDRGRVARYLKALHQDVLRYSDLGKHNEVKQLHFGGGSPNFLSSEEMIQVMNDISAIFPSVRDRLEHSIELDPRETSIDQIRSLINLGFSRFSFGVQDFDPHVQEVINRTQSEDDTATLLDESRRLGIREVNFDLIYGLPEQTLESWGRTLSTTIKMRPNRLAVYGYAHVDWRSKSQKAFNSSVNLPSPHQRIQLFILAYSMLTKAGYYYLGLDHFALEDDSLAIAHRAGKMRRNFMGYSTQAGLRVLGFGASAISSNNYAFSQNEVGVDEYCLKMETDTHAISRGRSLTAEDQIRRDMIEEVMCNGKIDISKYQGRWSPKMIDQLPALMRSIESLVGDELVTFGDMTISSTLKGRVFLRSIAALFDDYLSQHKDNDKVFSKAI